MPDETVGQAIGLAHPYVTCQPQAEA
jgi:hypothetical protein